MNVTKQEAFDAAWNGLKAQGFVRTDRFKGAAARGYEGGAPCVSHDGLRCAWKHIMDTFGTNSMYEYPEEVSRHDWIGLHNLATSPADMERRLREFAKAEGLTVPGEPDAFQAFMAKVQEPVLNEAERATEYLSGRCITRGVDSTH